MLGVFTDQAQNLILLAEDEARMLGRMVVMPEHLLLALTRHGNVRSLFAERDVSGSDVYSAIVRVSGLGDDLPLGVVPRSRATDAVLERAVDVAAERGVLGPSSEHLLPGLVSLENACVSAALRELGIEDVVALVDSVYRNDRPAVSGEQLKQFLLRAAARSELPQPGPIPPVFERFTADAQRAVRAAREIAALLEHHYVEPLHVLLGCLHVPDSVAARVLEAELEPSDMGTHGEAMERARMYGAGPSHQATGLFTEAAREIVAETGLSYAYRHDHASIATGHLLLATLDCEDRVIDRILGTGVMGSGPVNDRLARALVRALPGDEQPTGRADRGWIALDLLIRILVDQFREVLPPGWTIFGSGRSGGLMLKVPDSRSETDFRIDFEWILTSDQPARERLLEVTRAALAALQAAVAETTSTNWPASTHQDGLPEPHAAITGDAINPWLRLWYGPPDAPALEFKPQILLNNLVQS